MMENNQDVLVKVENLGKKFCKDLKKSLLYGMQDVARELVGKSSKNELRPYEFWAVNNINFELKRGECLGLIGHNGAGKSTLLKILNGLIKPDKGSVTMNGRVAALIELGAGFNPILTGRENIYNNAAVLGFSKKEVDAKLEEIIDFSEIREFIDTPVRTYSSGMKVRLGFAVAAQMQPDVLIIDEVLAVGDIGFRIKCFNRITELLKTCAVIFVSHSMDQVGKICNCAMLLKRGESKIFSYNTSDVIQEYFANFDKEKESISGDGRVILKDLFLEGSSISNEGKVISQSRDKIKVLFRLESKIQVPNFFVAISVVDLNLRPVANICTLNESIVLSSQDFNKDFQIEFLNYLTPGKYTVNVEVTEVNTSDKNLFGGMLISVRNKLEFVSIGAKQTTYCPIQQPSEWLIM